MYTLEDDRETTSSLRKRDFDGTLQAPDSSGGAATGALHHPSLSTQVTSSFKKITTPAQPQVGGKGVALGALTIACIGVFFTAMDQTVVVTALPPIANDLNIGVTKLDHAAWIISAYLLGFVIAMPLMGRVSDIYGRRRIFLLCLSIFGIGSILCGLAPVFGQMWDLGFFSRIDLADCRAFYPGSWWWCGCTGGDGHRGRFLWRTAARAGTGCHRRCHRGWWGYWPALWRGDRTAIWLAIYLLSQCSYRNWFDDHGLEIDSQRVAPARRYRLGWYGSTRFSADLPEPWPGSARHRPWANPRQRPCPTK